MQSFPQKPIRCAGLRGACALRAASPRSKPNLRASPFNSCIVSDRIAAVKPPQ